MARLPYVIPYDPEFLGEGFQVPLPKTCCQGKLLGNGEVYDYIHFSLVMHEDRRSALYTAHNIDVSLKHSARRTGWDLDPRIDSSNQIGNEAYKNNPWDRGHLVRRNAVAWGHTRQEAQDASDSTFYYPVSALQHSTFNQSNSKWLGLEDWILQKAGTFATRLCVFTGPVYTEVDQEERGVKIPSAFWKIVVLRDPTADGNDLSAVAFLMKQNENWRTAGIRALTNLEPYHVSIAEIEAYTGIRFGTITEFDEFDWRQVRFRDRKLMPPIPINGPDDIVFSGNRRRSKGVRALRKFSSGTALKSMIKELPSSSNRSVDHHDCGCKDQSMDFEAEIKALKTQTNNLYKTIELLMEGNQGNLDERSMRNLRSIISRIIGGQMVQPGEFPDCAAIGDDSGYFCTGVLVHEKVVLTAAHCADFQITKVFLRGRQISDPGSGQVRAVEKVVVHPQYSSFQTPQHDIAVLILQDASTVAPIEIASKEEINNDDSLVLVGFGSDTPDGMSGYGTKRKVNVALTNTSGFSEAEVRQIQERHGYEINHEFHGGDLHSGKDTCNGDSGGPAYLITPDGTLKVAGLTSRAAASFIDLCGDGGIYTRVEAYLPWLHEATEGLIGTAPVIVDPVIEEPETGEPSTSAQGGLYISATLPNPAGADAGNEWVEITNNSTDTISMDNYRIQDKQGGRLALQGPLAAGAKHKIIIPANHAIKLSNSGDEIKLLLDGDPIHEVGYSRAGSGEVISFESPYDEEINDGGGEGGNGGGENNGGNNGNGDDDCKCKCKCKCHDIDPDICGGPIDPEFTPGALPC